MDSFPLSHFPSELLELIVADSYLLLALWKCGNDRLNSKLASAITQVRFESYWSHQFGMPTIVFDLRSLRHLQLSSRGMIMKSPENWPTFMRSLPGTLETIDIASRDSGASLINFGPHGPRSTPYPLGESRFIDLGALFPRLHTLKVHTLPGRRVQDPIISPDLAGLPPTLTRLRAVVQFFNITTDALLALLPRSLLHLEATIEGPTNEDGLVDWQQAPPNLETISEIKVTAYNRKSYYWLPRSLVYAKIVPKRMDEDLSVLFTPEAMLTLPPHFANLQLETSSSWSSPNLSWLSVLPAKLTRLELLSTLKSFSAADLEMLPSTLTHFSVISKSMDWKSLEAADAIAKANSQSFWPPLLTDLEIEVPMRATRFSLLPRTLRRLKAGIGLLLSSALSVENLPPSLTDLSLDYEYAESASEKLSCKGLLPSGLKSLNLNNTIGATSIALTLPHLLTSIQASGFINAVFSDATILQMTLPCCDRFDLLPRTLTSFHLRTLDFVDDQLIDLSVLPSSLTSFTIAALIRQAGRPQLELTSFAHLSRLKVLRIPHTLPLPSKVFRHLPKSLTDLMFRLATFEEDDLPFIPPLLEGSNFYPYLESPTELGKYWPLGLDRIPGSIKEVVAARRHALPQLSRH